MENSKTSFGWRIFERLLYVFGLSILNATVIGDCFCIGFAEILPQNPAVQKFGDYLIVTYILEGVEFPLEIWAERSSLQRTTNTQNLTPYFIKGLPSS